MTLVHELGYVVVQPSDSFIAIGIKNSGGRIMEAHTSKFAAHFGFSLEELV
jgi:hypothetical protein